MPYIDQQQLVTRFGEAELQALAPDGQGGIDADTVARACVDAAGEIDARLVAAGYTTPLNPVPSVVTAHAADIARYRLYDEHATEVVIARYQHAIKFLRDVARGEVMLGSNDEPTAPEATAQFDSKPPVMPGGGF